MKEALQATGGTCKASEEAVNQTATDSERSRDGV